GELLRLRRGDDVVLHQRGDVVGALLGQRGRLELAQAGQLRVLRGDLRGLAVDVTLHGREVAGRVLADPELEGGTGGTVLSDPALVLLAGGAVGGGSARGSHVLLQDNGR